MSRRSNARIVRLALLRAVVYDRLHAALDDLRGGRMRWAGTDARSDAHSASTSREESARHAQPFEIAAAGRPQAELTVCLCLLGAHLLAAASHCTIPTQQQRSAHAQQLACTGCAALQTPLQNAPAPHSNHISAKLQRKHTQEQQTRIHKQQRACRTSLAAGLPVRRSPSTAVRGAAAAADSVSYQ
jgi:hypothetical protein